MGVKFKGMKEFQKKMRDMEKKAEELDGKQNVPFDELFTTSFMQKYTNYSSMDEMLDDSPFTVETNEDFDNIPEEQLDTFVAANTQFPKWEEMLGKAGEEWTAKQLGF